MPASNGATVKNNLTLPTKGYLGTNVVWSTSDENVMTSSGMVKGNGTVTLTCSIQKDGYAYNRDVSINVTGTTGIKHAESGDEAAMKSQHTRKVDDGIRNGRTYDIQGREVEENYRGMVVKDGKKVAK